MHNLGGKTKLFLTLLPISSLLLFLLYIQTDFINLTPKSSTKIVPTQIHIHKHKQVAFSTCQGTLYPELCVSTLTSFPNLTSKSIPQIISSIISHTKKQVKASFNNCTSIERQRKSSLTTIQKRAIEDCLLLFDDTISELNKVLSDLSSLNSASKHYHDLQTLLSTAMTNQDTCLDGFAQSKSNYLRNYIKKDLNNISNHVSNTLVMLKKIPVGKNRGSKKTEVFPEYGSFKDGFPSWVSSKDRKLLQSSVNQTKYNLVVAKDGTGNFTTISEAVNAAPNSSDTRFVIYIKGGAYFENVEVERKKMNLMFVGDGISKTVVKASRNVVDGWTTFRSATVGKWSLGSAL